jgi:phosphoribosylamine--glycine ligase
MSLKVLLVGNGAREHAIAKKIVQNEGILFSFMSKENPGISQLAKRFSLGDLNDFKNLKKFKRADFAIIGPENPLANGIVNFLEDTLEIPVCGPRKEVAKIETSKIFTRMLLEAYNIPGNVPYLVVKSINDLETAVEEFGIDFVIKPDGLTGGKGVKVGGDHFKDLVGAQKYINKLLKVDGELLIEEKKKGREFSLQVFTDGKKIIPMPLVRDYKRAYEDNKGPNTGSMGSYSLPTHDLPFLNKTDYEKALNIIKLTIDALNKQNGIKYRGILYGQFMKTDEGIFLIEFNARFGDPEAMNVLKLLETDFNKLTQQIIDGELKKANFRNNATLCTYLVPEGYPTKPISNAKIEIDKTISSDIFFASVYKDGKKILTTSSRAIALLEEGETLEIAREKVYQNTDKIKGQIYYRKDIGSSL